MPKPMPLQVACAFCGGPATGRVLPASRHGERPSSPALYQEFNLSGQNKWVHPVCDECASNAADPAKEPPRPTY
jgi:hypothetical protein